jgi:hypothetical protein
VVVVHGQRLRVDALGRHLHDWTARRMDRVVAGADIYSPRIGQVRLTRVRIHQPKRPYLYLVTNQRACTPSQAWACKVSRWQVEIVFTQMTKGGAFSRRTGRQDVADLDLAVGDDDTIDQEFDQLSALGKIQVFQGRLDALAEGPDAFRQFGHIDLALRLGIQLAQLLRQTVLGLLHLLSFALEFVAANNLGQIGIQQPRLLALKLGKGILDRLPAGLERLWQPLAPVRPLQFVADQARLGQHLTQILPDERIQGGRRNVAGRTALARGRA